MYCGSSLEWIKAREPEVQAMKETKELEKELSEVLKKTRSGLKQVRHHVQKMENLSVTSVHVPLDPEVDLETVCSSASPKSSLLYCFQPVLLNRSIYQAQLQKYTAATMCLVDGWKSNNVLAKFDHSKQPRVRLPDLPADRVGNVLAHIRALPALRSNQAFKMSVLFKNQSQSFVTAGRESRPQLEQWLQELEGCAEKLDSMNKGARILELLRAARALSERVCASMA
uniref:PH domain-containing protein n=1 Tax=Knipowitschia caucasica TaxID=637954 RepID=A0AAV2K0F9_KNICA